MDRAPGDDGPLAGRGRHHKPRAGTPDGAQPVFVDGSGTRRRWFVLLGAITSVLLVVAVGLVAAGFLGGGSGYLPGLPGVPGFPQAAVAAASSPAGASGGARAGHGAVRSTGPTPAVTAASPAGSAAATPSATPPTPSASPAPAGHRNTAAPGLSKKK